MYDNTRVPTSIDMDAAADHDSATHESPAPQRVPVDSPRMRDQEQLTTASGATWLGMAGATALLVGGMMLALWVQTQSIAAAIGVAVVLALFAGMLVVRVVVRRGSLRLMLLAAGFIAMVVAGLALTGLVAITAIR